ncbi:MAG: hypothetical protein AAF821_25850 [Cyanobacteria bacterium P01_D01_bin.156]
MEEYWIIDPIQECISVLILVNGFYEVVEFRGNEIIESPKVRGFNLKTVEILNTDSGD